MPEVVVRLLPWVVPPLLGAIIGYITNAVAISMLFRPYREIRVFGVRLPFTPGIIPRQRFELAESIAGTVESELLTEETIRSQTERPEFRAGLTSGISSFSRNILSTPFSGWGDILPGAGDKAGDIARGFLSSNAFEHLVNNIVSKAADTLLDTPLSAILGREGDMQQALDTFLARLPEENFLDRTTEGIETWLIKQGEKEARISDFLKDADIAALSEILDGLYMPLFEGIITFLKKDETLDELEIRSRRFLHDVIDKLSGLQRLLITAGQYDRTLDENMDKIVIDLVAHLEKAGRTAENRKNVISFFEGEIKRLSDTGVGDTGEKRDRFMYIVRTVMQKLKDILSDAKLRGAVSEKIAAALVKEGRTLRSVIGAVPGLTQHDLERYVSGAIVRMVRSVFPGKKALVAPGTMAEGLEHDFRNQSLEALLSLDEDDKVRLDGYISDWMITLINKKIPDILRSVGIHELVVNRVNSFDIVKMEKLILQVVKKHLRWITVFGGFLGAIIGFAQILANLFLG